ncbi:MAG TPA: ABC transporter ATP-binding protein [Chthoniobacterales bacterium]
MPKLLEVENLSIAFGEVTCVHDISFSLSKGETLAVVGESGSGKSVTALSLARLNPTPPARYTDGRILLDGGDVLRMREAEVRAIRGRKIGYIFQEPSTSLNPVLSIRAQMAEMLRLHRPDVARNEINAEVIRWLDLVGIVNPAQRLRDNPFQLSGGMQQRVMIAMALCARPEILVADEPTTALDVTIQAQIIALLKDLKAKLGMSVLMITHNFGLVNGLADRVIVMFRGEIVEEGETAKVIREPSHPYTKALIACIPRVGSRLRRLPNIAELMAQP